MIQIPKTELFEKYNFKIEKTLIESLNNALIHAKIDTYNNTQSVRYAIQHFIETHQYKEDKHDKRGN